MTDDLTNPDILKALEVAPVEFLRGSARLRLRLCAVGGVAAVQMWNSALGEWTLFDDATPADLDHALKDWLEWLKAKRNYVSLAFEDGKWVVEAANHIEDVGRDGYVRGTGRTPLLALARAVVKVGKPLEENDGG